MEIMTHFSFGEASVAKSYDNILVPYLFDDWAKDLTNNNGPWNNKTILDLASGTGIVLKYLVQQKPSKIFAIDINKEMLSLAKEKIYKSNVNTEFIVASADNLPLEDNCIDTVVCQQGFQFFPDKSLASKELFRVLKPGGKIIISTWCPVSECQFFGTICEVLEDIGEPDIAQKMRIPFDLMPRGELEISFVNAKFDQVNVEKRILNFTIDEGVKTIIKLAYATPIGPDIKALSNWQNNQFKAGLIKKTQRLGSSSNSLGKMVSYVLTATKS